MWLSGKATRRGEFQQGDKYKAGGNIEHSISNTTLRESRIEGRSLVLRDDDCETIDSRFEIPYTQPCRHP